MLKNRYCGELSSRDIGTVVNLAGWVNRRRDHGGLIFIDMRDLGGLVQIVFNPETDPAGSSLQGFFEKSRNNLLGDPGLDEPFDRETPRFAPLPSTPADGGAVVLPSGFFTQVGFRGGVDPANDWIAKGVADGWIYFIAL